jgi:hypothetical protein
MFFDNLTVFFFFTVTNDKSVDSKFGINEFQELKILTFELIIQY